MYTLKFTADGALFTWYGCDAKKMHLNYCNNEGYAEKLGLPTVAYWDPIRTLGFNTERMANIMKYAGEPTISAFHPKPGPTFSRADVAMWCGIATILSGGGGAVPGTTPPPPSSLTEPPKLYGPTPYRSGSAVYNYPNNVRGDALGTAAGMAGNWSTCFSTGMGIVNRSNAAGGND